MYKQDKINFIKVWYAYKNKMCELNKNNCEQCILCESIDGWRGDSGKYEYVPNCKYDFEELYAEDILNLMENQI